MPLGVLLKVYRVAERAVWDYFKQVIARLPEDDPRRTEILVFLWDRGRTWIDGSIEQLIQVFYQEEQAIPHGMLARRAEAVHAVLRGDPTSVDTATQDLGHQLSSTHLGLVLWADDDGNVRDPVARIHATAASLALRLGAPKPLLLPVGRREVWGWLSLPSAADLRVISDVVSERGRGESVRMASGLPARGVAGFRQSHREALDTQRLVVGSGSTARFTSYGDVELICLVDNKPESARALIGRELRGLAGSDPALAKVRETVRLYLTCGANVDMTATNLIVHKNTVRYRLAQAEELIGHALTERRTQVELALRYLEWHPAS
jgi:DNA-binding PucR family transcriptional regulator